LRSLYVVRVASTSPPFLPFAFRARHPFGHLRTRGRSRRAPHTGSQSLSIAFTIVRVTQNCDLCMSYGSLRLDLGQLGQFSDSQYAALACFVLGFGGVRRDVELGSGQTVSTHVRSAQLCGRVSVHSPCQTPPTLSFSSLPPLRLPSSTSLRTPPNPRTKQASAASWRMYTDSTTKLG
jgi:hypothetical protein